MGRRIALVSVVWLLAAAGAAADHRRRMPDFAQDFAAWSRQTVVV